MKVNYTKPYPFRPIPAITPLDGYWQNGTWKFNMSEITAGAASQPSWIDIILKGNTALTLVNSKAHGLNYLKLFGDCEQSGTPTPTVPVDIVCNNGAIKYGAIGKNLLDIAESNIDLGYYINDSGVRTASPLNFYCLKFIPVKTGTTYTWSTSVSINYISFMEYDSTGTFLRRTLIGSTSVPAGTSGQFTTRDDTTYIRIGSNPFGETLTMEQIQAVNWQFEVGSTATAYEPYRGGIYTDGTTETVEVTGKNLFDINAPGVDTGHYINDIGTVILDNVSTISDFIPCVEGGYYTARAVALVANSNLRVHGYDKNKNWVQMLVKKTAFKDVITTATCQIPAGIKYIKICGYIARPYGKDTMFELGDTATTYEPYYNSGTATAEMLLAIDDNKDEQNVTSGGVIRNIGYVILDGSETFTTSTAYGKACLMQSAAGIWGADKNKAVLCTHFLGEPTTTGRREDYTCFFNVSGHFYFRLEDNTVATFKQFLADQYNAGTPVIVFFVKATPTTESVTSQPLTIQAGTNVVEITQASMDDLELEVSYKAGVSVTVTEIENAQLDNSVEVTVNG